VTGAPPPEEIDREIDFHIQETVDTLVATGMDPTAARAEATRRYGDRRRHATAIRSAYHQTTQSRPPFSQLWSTAMAETRFVVRGLRRSPGYTLTAIATLALVTGANLTMFGIADGLTFRPLTYLRSPSDVHRVYWQWRDRGKVTTSASTQYTRFVDLRRDATTFSEIAVFAERTVPVGDGAQAQQRPIAAVSASYFALFDARPARGRFFTDAEDAIPRGADVAVLGHAYWRAEMQGREVLGEILRVGNIRATIIGIAPEGFDGLNDGRPPAAFVPITTYAASTGTDDARTYFSAYKWGWVHILFRRANGIDLPTATADATRVFRATWPRFVADNPSMAGADTANPQVVLSAVRSGAGPTAGPEARTALWLLAVAGAVLLIGCANIANLSLTRALARRHEVRLKRALGVSNGRLMTAALIEAGLVAACGGIVALAVAQLLRSALAPVLRSLRLADLSVFSDGRTLVVTAAVVALTMVITGLMPAVMLRRADMGGALKGSARTGTSEGRRVRGVLLAGQAMLSVALLVAAGLFVRSLIAAHVAPLGYDASRVLIVNRFIPPGAFDADQQRVLRGDLLRAAAALPDVESAAWMSSAPFVSTSWTDLFVPGRENVSALGPFTLQATTSDYFRTMGTTIVRGRALQATDVAGAPEVAVISQSMARTLWPDREPIGQCFRMRSADSPCFTVVGVAEDMVQRTLADGPRLHYYVPIDQYPRTFGNGLLLRLRGDPAARAESVRVALQRVLPAGSYLLAQPLSTVVADQQASWRMGAAVLLVFGVLALLVAGVGLLGVVSYDIAQRTREWAVRIALGADRLAIVTMVVGRSVRLVLAGVVPGLLVAALFGRWVQPLLFRTSALDPLTYAVAASVMIGVALVASTLPALRASRADPSAALRSE
jgi:putative ABC transport system permease protein